MGYFCKQSAHWLEGHAAGNAVLLLVAQLYASNGKNLYAVVGIWVVRSSDYGTSTLLLSSNECNERRWHNAQRLHTCTTRNEARAECGKQTLPGFASVAANNNSVDAKHLCGNTAKVKNVFFAQFVEGNATNAVGSKSKHLSHTTHSKRRARTQRFNALCTEAPCAPS